MASDSKSARLIRHTLAGVTVLLFPGSCGPAYIAPPVNVRLAGNTNSPVPLLERGYAVHQAKCAKCHPFQNPADHDEVELSRDIMPAMARKAKLDPADEKAVLAYLLAARNIPERQP